MYAVLASDMIVGKLVDVFEVTTLEDAEEEIGSADESGDREDGVYDISLPNPVHDPEEENGERDFNGDYCYCVEVFHNEHPLSVSNMNLTL
jgi:hypothetical protein